LPKRVIVRVTAFPATAKLYLGGELLPSNPLAQSFQKDPARTLMLVAEAPAHQRETRVVRLDQDWDIVLTLTPEAPVSAAKTRPKLKASATRTPAETAALPGAAVAPEPDCNPPYFFDERGVKKYKSRCL